MKKVLILYATLTGMTAEIATTLHERLVEALPTHDVTLLNVTETSPDVLPTYRQVIFGASTWDHGIPPPDGEVFLANLITEKPDLSNTKFALFGLGDSVYPAFCEALVLMKNDLKQCNAQIDEKEFTMDGYPGEQTMVELVDWAKQFILSPSS